MCASGLRLRLSKRGRDEITPALFQGRVRQKGDASDPTRSSHSWRARLEAEAADRGTKNGEENGVEIDSEGEVGLPGQLCTYA